MIWISVSRVVALKRNGLSALHHRFDIREREGRTLVDGWGDLARDREFVVGVNEFGFSSVSFRHLLTIMFMLTKSSVSAEPLKYSCEIVPATLNGNIPNWSPSGKYNPGTFVFVTVPIVTDGAAKGSAFACPPPPPKLVAVAAGVM